MGNVLRGSLVWDMFLLAKCNFVPPKEAIQNGHYATMPLIVCLQSGHCCCSWHCPKSDLTCGWSPQALLSPTERMECNIVIHPPSMYPKAGNDALRDQWAINYKCQNDSLTIAFTVRDFVQWNHDTSENIPCVCKSWKSLLIYVFATYIFCSTDTHSTELNFR